MRTKQVLRNRIKTMPLKVVSLSSLLIFLFLSLISSAPPLTTNINTAEGLQIFAPQYDSVKQNQGFILYLHISNISNGVPLPNTYANCYIHIYGSNGSHTLESGALELDGNGLDYELEIDAGNFTDLGTHSYFIWCNSTDGKLGGEIRGMFDVTPSGNSGNANIVFFIFIILFAFGVTVIGLVNKNAPITILGGMLMMFLGIYMLNNGIIIYRDNLTNYISYVTIASGFIFAIWAGLELMQDL